MERELTYADYIRIYDEAALIERILNRFRKWHRVTPSMVEAALTAVNPEIYFFEDEPHLAEPDATAVMRAINTSIRKNPAYREDMRRWVIKMEQKEFKAARRKLLRRQLNLN